VPAFKYYFPSAVGSKVLLLPLLTTKAVKEYRETK
jgi:hypothetical protein